MSALIEINALETARFGVTCARLDGSADPFPALDAVNRQALEQGVEMLSTRVDARDLARVHALEADGYRLMDTLVYYRRTLGSLPAVPVRPGCNTSFDLAHLADAQEIRQVSKAAFADYFGHYHADPLLDPDRADEAYADWAYRGVLGQNTTTPVLTCRRDGQIVGFLMARKNTQTEAEIVLAGMMPQAQGQGLYRLMFVQGLHLLKDLGATRIVISTQITNHAVQKVWASLGLVPVRHYYTLHKWFCGAAV